MESRITDRGTEWQGQFTEDTGAAPYPTRLCCGFCRNVQQPLFIKKTEVRQVSLQNQCGLAELDLSVYAGQQVTYRLSESALVGPL